MNLRKYIKAQQKILESDLNIYEKAVMNCLIIKANQFGRGEDLFYLTNEDILKSIGLSIKSKNTIRPARNKLIELGYINFTAGKKGEKSTYYINWDKIIGKEPILEINEEETF